MHTYTYTHTYLYIYIYLYIHMLSNTTLQGENAMKERT